MLMKTYMFLRIILGYVPKIHMSLPRSISHKLQQDSTSFGLLNFQLAMKITLVRRHHYIDLPHANSERLISDSTDKDDSCLCPLCDKMLSTKYKVKAHIKRVHHGEKPFKCSKCEKRFAQRHHFKDHMSRSEMRGYCPGRWRNSNKF